MHFIYKVSVVTIASFRTVAMNALIAHFLVSIIAISTTLAAVHLRIPFKEDCDSRFTFHLEQFDESTLLDCTGEILVRNLTNKLIFNFRNVKVQRNVNVQKSAVKRAASLPILMFVTDKTILDPKDYNDWDWVDPRILVKIMKYTNLNEYDRAKEIGWEVGDDLECPLTSNKVDIDEEYSQIELVYQLDDCIDPVGEEFVQTHHRIVNFRIDKESNLIKRIEYHYEKTNKEYDKQNNAEIVFQNFVSY